LADLQRAQHRRSAFEYLSPAEIHRCSKVRSSEPLFDTLLVWLAAVETLKLEGLDVTPLDGRVETGYPLTLGIAETRDGLSIHATLRQSWRLEQPLAEVVAMLAATLGVLAAAAPDDVLGMLPGFRGARRWTKLATDTTTERGADLELASSATVATQAGREEADDDLLRDLIKAEWRAALGADRVDDHDDFFALGGDSLQAARLHDRIQTISRKSVPLLALFRRSTLDGMVETLISGDWPLRSSIVVPLREGGSKPALFCVASPEVNTVGYAMLARHLAKDQPVFVLQAPPDSATIRRVSPGQLPVLARRYVDAMRAVQPQGPYYLLGMCGGAQLTLNMGRELAATGERTAFAGIINTWAFYTVSRRYHLWRLMGRAQWYRKRFKEIARLPLAKQLATLQAIAARRWVALRAILKLGAGDASNPSTGSAAAKPVGSEAPRDSSPDPAGDPWIEEVGWAHKLPEIDKHEGSLTVFRIRPQQPWRTRHADLGWGLHVASVDVEYLPGNDHEVILRAPAVEVIADRLSTRLDAARRSEASS
jgi:thioesterase domain-containing protein